MIDAKIKARIAIYLFRAYMVYSVIADILLVTGMGYLILENIK